MSGKDIPSPDFRLTPRQPCTSGTQSFVVTRAQKKAALLLAGTDTSGSWIRPGIRGFLTRGNRGEPQAVGVSDSSFEAQAALRCWGNLTRADFYWKSKISMGAIIQNRVRKGLYFGGSGPMPHVHDAILL